MTERVTARSRMPHRTTFGRDDPDWGIMLRSLTVIWGVGATFFLAVLVGTTLPARTHSMLQAIDLIAFAVLGLLLAGRERLPDWTPDLCAYLLYLVVGGVIAAYGQPDSPYAFLYLWLAVHSFYFLPWRRAVPQLGVIAADYAAVLLAMPGSQFAALRWAVTVLTTVLICTLVALLRSRVDTLVRRLGEIARTDPLTGLRNRRAYDELIGSEIARSARTHQPFSLIICDLDHFKQVNDQLGHHEGDEVLRRVAVELERTARRVDAVTRIGGEEFGLILPNTDADGALVLAERLRRTIRVAFREDPVPVTISLGVACHPHDGLDAESLFEAADGALLAAKAEGRDRVVVWERAAQRLPR